MFVGEYYGINSLLVDVCKKLISEGRTRNVRGFECVEFPEPVILKIKDPTARWITIPERKWNPILPYAESLWLASGRNDMDFIQYFLPSLLDFSDDGVFMRGGYGPRFRNFSGNNVDYKIGNNSLLEAPSSCNVNTDQFLYVLKCFEKDRYTRQAVITIGDPAKDCFSKEGVLKITKDIPCTRLIQFLCTPDNKLNMSVFMRSNDVIWGLSGVNIFNFTFMQEYFARMLGLDVGSYYHIVNNLHYYKNRHQEMVENLSMKSPDDIGFKYKKNFNSLKEFDKKIGELIEYENSLRNDQYGIIPNFGDDFFNDWASVFYHKKTNRSTKFINPLLNKIFNDSSN